MSDESNPYEQLEPACEAVVDALRQLRNVVSKANARFAREKERMESDVAKMFPGGGDYPAPWSDILAELEELQFGEEEAVTGYGATFREDIYRPIKNSLKRLKAIADQIRGSEGPDARIYAAGVTAGAYKGKDIGDRNMLEHAVSDVAIVEGRLKRSPNEALCNKKLDLADSYTWEPGDDITCPQCKEIVGRITVATKAAKPWRDYLEDSESNSPLSRDGDSDDDDEPDI